MTNATTCFVNSVSCTLSLLGSTCQTLSDIKVLTKLATIPNPALAITKILLNRFVSGFVFTNYKKVTTIEETLPYQGKIDIEVLRVSNDRTHLEGVWNIKNRAEIETKQFTTKAPEHKVHTHVKESGFSICLNPLAIGMACIHPGVLAVGASLPVVGVSSATSDTRIKDNFAQVITADDLFIRCDDAVFSGSKIQGRLIECIVSGDLKIEDLMSEFQSVEECYNFSINLSTIFDLVKSFHDKTINNYRYKEEITKLAIEKGVVQDCLTNTTFTHPIFGLVPQMRFAEEKTIRKEVQNLASLVGKEKFYLHVANVLHKKNALIGIVPPDGVVANTENEIIEAGKILEEKVQQTHHHESHVFNPCLYEFVNMMAACQSWRKKLEDYELEEYEKALKEKKPVNDARLHAKHERAKLKEELDNSTKIQLDSFLKGLLLYDKNLTAQKEAGFYDDRNEYQNEESYQQEQSYQQEKSPRSNQQDKSPRSNQQKQSPRSNQQDKSPRSNQQKQSPRSNQQDKSPRPNQQETNYQANEIHDFNNNNQSETNESNGLYITDEKGEQIVPDSISLEQAAMIHSRLPLDNISIQEIAILVQFTRDKLSDQGGKRFPFMTENTFVESVQRLYAEDLLKYKDVNWNDCKHLDCILYQVFKSMADVGEFLVKHKEFIDNCFDMASYYESASHVFKQIRSRAFQFGYKMGDRAFSRLMKKNKSDRETLLEFKFNKLEEFFAEINKYSKVSCDFIQDKYQEYVIKFATLVTDDHRVSDQIIRAGKVLPEIVKDSAKCYFTFSGKGKQLVSKYRSCKNLANMLKPGKGPINFSKPANLNRSFHVPHTTNSPSKSFGSSKQSMKPANLNRPFNDDPPPRPPANSLGIPKQQNPANLNRNTYNQPEIKSKIHQSYEAWKAAQNMK